jgi:hypothetical protein
VFRKNIFVEYEKTIMPQTLAETLDPFLAAGKGDLVDIGYRVMMNLTVDFTGIDRTEAMGDIDTESDGLDGYITPFMFDDPGKAMCPKAAPPWLARHTVFGCWAASWRTPMKT